MSFLKGMGKGLKKMGKSIEHAANKTVNLPGEAIDRDHCDNVIKEIIPQFKSKVFRYDWEPNVTDLNAAFEDLKQETLAHYDDRVDRRHNDQDSVKAVRRRMLDKNLDKELPSFLKLCEDQKKQYSGGIEKIFKQCKQKAHETCLDIQSTQLPLSKADLHAKLLVVDDATKKDFEREAPGPDGAQRLKDLDHFLDDLFNEVNTANKKLIAAKFGYGLSDFTTMVLNETA